MDSTSTDGPPRVAIAIFVQIFLSNFHTRLVLPTGTTYIALFSTVDTLRVLLAVASSHAVRP